MIFQEKKSNISWNTDANGNEEQRKGVNVFME